MCLSQGASYFNCPTRRAAKELTAAGAPAFLYHFTHLPVSPLPGCVGVCHSSEIVFVFDFQFQLKGAAELQLGLDMNTYWANFAKTHVPSAPDAPAWAAYDPSKDNYLQLDVGSKLMPVTDVMAKQCDFWEMYYEKYPQPSVHTHRTFAEGVVLTA